MKNRKKCPFGGVVSPQATLDMNAMINDQALAQAESGWWNPAIATAGTLVGSSFGILNDKFGMLNKKDAAYGIPVEVEGGETAELPNGQIMPFVGPSHENGGIDVTLPNNTKVYSDRISINGETLSERKIKRERKARKYDRIEEKNGDILSKNSNKRLKDILEKEDAKDMALEENVRNAVEYTFGNEMPRIDLNMGCGGRIKAKYGLNGKDKRILFPEKMFDGVEGEIPDLNFDYSKLSEYSDPFHDSPVLRGKYKLHDDKPNYGKIGPENYITDNDDEDKELPEYKYHSTIGDIIGVTGNALQAYLPFMNTMRNRSGDTINSNPYTGYNLKAIREQEEANELLSLIRDKNIREHEMTRRNTVNQANNRATGFAQAQALAIAAQTQKDAAVQAETDAYIENMLKGKSALAQLLSERDKIVMEGNEKAAEKNKQDRDAFYTARAKDLVSIGRGVTSVGTLLNRSKENAQKINMLRQKLRMKGWDIDENMNLIRLK